MTHLLNLLAAIALLVWGTQLVRTGILRVLGANLGSGALAVLTTLSAKVETRQVPLGNLVFKSLGIVIVAPLVGWWLSQAEPLLGSKASLVVVFHLCFNLLVALLFIGLTQVVARWVEYWLPRPAKTTVAGRQRHLDASALATPSLAKARRRIRSC